MLLEVGKRLRQAILDAEPQISVDWADMDDEHRLANEQDLRDGTRLLSVNCSATGIRFWIITEADRAATTVLLPEDC